MSAANWWGVHAGFGKDGYNRPVNGVPHKGVWNWETPVHGDSLQGWWPLINLYASTGGQTRTDRNRPWWALDIGNMANYRINQANGRTFGVVGVWHRDGGSLTPAPAGLPSPEWTPAQGSHAAWMGLRAHGDNAYCGRQDRQPVQRGRADVHGFGAISAGRQRPGLPRLRLADGPDALPRHRLHRQHHGQPHAALQVPHRDVDRLSTRAPATRTGWFDSDPLGVVSGPSNPQRNNFISSSDAGDALAPRDSFMVYIGQGIENQNWLPAASNFGQNFPARTVYDQQRRWFGEVLRWDRDPGSHPANPQPLYYREMLSVTGVWPARADTSNAGYVDTTFVIPNAALAPLLENNRLRLVFRVKTNRGFDDQGTALQLQPAGRGGGGPRLLPARRRTGGGVRRLRERQRHRQRPRA